MLPAVACRRFLGLLKGEEMFNGQETTAYHQIVG